MVVGTTLFKLDGNPYYSPQFRRGGLAATFAVDVTHVSSANFDIEVEHRNEDDTLWSTAGMFSTATATGVDNLNLNTLKEILRFKYSFGAGDASTAAVHFLMMAPAWRPY